MKASKSFVMGLIVVGLSSGLVWADGTETLGPPSIPIAAGSGIAVGGVGLESQPGTLDVDVPGDVEQVILYWAGATRDETDSGDDTIVVDGTEVTGTLIGGPAFFFSFDDNSVFHSNYRADITGLGLVSSGANSLSVEGLDFSFENSGAGVLVIYSDGTTAAIGAVDGLDLAFRDFPDPRQTTVPQTISFDPADEDRVADIAIFAGSVGGADRENTIRVTTGGNVRDFVDPLSSSAGELWDSIVLNMMVPAGADSLTVQILSGPDGDLPASLNWVGAGVSVPVPEEPGLCWLTGGGVKFEAILGMDLATHGPRDSVGGVIAPSCDLDPSRGGQWNQLSHRLKLHFQAHAFDRVACGNVPGIEPGSESPVTDFNYIEAWGSDGTLKGIRGNRTDLSGLSYFFRIEDRNEPGNEQANTDGADVDRYFLHVWDENGDTVLLIEDPDGDGDPSTVEPLTITGGNMQIHQTSCDDGGGASLPIEQEPGFFFIPRGLQPRRGGRHLRFDLHVEPPLPRRPGSSLRRRG